VLGNNAKMQHGVSFSCLLRMSEYALTETVSLPQTEKLQLVWKHGDTCKHMSLRLQKERRL